MSAVTLVPVCWQDLIGGLNRKWIDVTDGAPHSLLDVPAASFRSSRSPQLSPLWWAGRICWMNPGALHGAGRRHAICVHRAGEQDHQHAGVLVRGPRRRRLQMVRRRARGTPHASCMALPCTICVRPHDGFRSRTNPMARPTNTSSRSLAARKNTFSIQQSPNLFKPSSRACRCLSCYESWPIPPMM